MCDPPLVVMSECVICLKKSTFRAMTISVIYGSLKYLPVIFAIRLLIMVRDLLELEGGHKRVNV